MQRDQICGFDPAERNIGHIVYDPVTGLSQWMLLDLHPFLPPVKIPKPRKYKIPLVDDKPKKPKRKVVPKPSQDHFVAGIVRMLRQPRLAEYFRRVYVALIEFQAISKPRIKLVSNLLHSLIPAVYPHVVTYYVNPVRFRAFFQITVRKADYPKLNTEKKRYKKRKEQSLSTDMISDADEARIRETFIKIHPKTKAKSFHGDCADASIMVKYFEQNEAEVIADDKAEQDRWPPLILDESQYMIRLADVKLHDHKKTK
jgi:hypothetical protein